MIYVFQSGDEFLKLKIDRKEKKFETASRQTNMRFYPHPFWKLFGSPVKSITGFKQPTEEETKKEMEESEKLSDEDFERKIIIDAMKIGYQLVKKCPC